MFRWRETGPLIDRAFTDRFDGLSGGEFESLNLGDHVGDDATTVAGNRRLLAESFGVPGERLVFMRQVHGRDVGVLDAETIGAPGGAPVDGVDAMVTAEQDLALTVLVADCVPVLFADEDAGVIGVAHAGRQGMLARVVGATLAAMRDLGARTISATVGPSICGPCYEVPESMQAEAVGLEPATRATTRSGTPAIDVAAGVAAQLAVDHVALQRIPGCTREDGDLFSHRRDGVTGRTAGVIVRRAAAVHGGPR